MFIKATGDLQNPWLFCSLLSESVRMLVIDMNDVKPSNKYYDIDLRETLSSNRLVGLWRMLKGYYTAYFGANLSLAAGALAKTGTFLLLAYFIDNVLGQESELNTLLLIGAAFVLLAAAEGGFTYLSGRLAAFTAEGITRRLRNYLFDHIQRLTFPYHGKTPTGELIQRSTSDVDAVRRFFAEQAIGMGRILLLFLINFIASAQPERQPGADLDHRRAVHRGHFDLLLQEADQSLRSLPGTGSHPFHHPAGEPDRGAGGQGLCPPGLRERQVRKR